MKDVYETIDIEICQVPDTDVITASEIEVAQFDHDNGFLSVFSIE